MKATKLFPLALLAIMVNSLALGQASLSDTIDLFPVTVVALHPKSGEAESLELQYSDHLAHDGGALLTHINRI